ncbi:3-keto-5-aminohexanoate cleavage protein [Emcibacter sp.]|uniref:3-keto-5-aminohexanoate cleavage protein n=1 Tax=Emcibacter sp. TaxID=1979954 RepID=UPI003A9225DD
MTGDFRAFAREKIMIMSAPNGARRTHADHAALPMTPMELADCAERIRDAGASVLHLHVRDDEGRHSLDADRYRTALGAIRERLGNDLVLQVTTEAVGMYNRDQQMALVRDLRPEAVSLALREICPTDDDLSDASAFFSWCVAEHIWTQFILYDPKDLTRFEEMRRQGVFGQDHPSALFVLGRYAADLTGDPAELGLFLAAAGEIGFPWTCCCFGKTELDAMQKAADLGGHARLGFENNLLMEDGTIAPDNAALIEQLVSRLGPTGRLPARADDIRNAFFPL